MGRCLYLDSRGRRCGRQALEEQTFCAEHLLLGGGPPAEPIALRKLVFRVVALTLLVIFLIPLLMQGYRILRAWLN